MIFVADTGPLNYLIQIGHIEILGVMYGGVVIPPAVQDELLASLAPRVVRWWMENPPGWLEVRTPGRLDPRLNEALDVGEREAITLAQNSGGDVLLLIDERTGRDEAKRLGIEIIGTLGVLRQAHERGLLNIRGAVERLRMTNFKASEDLLRQFLGLP